MRENPYLADRVKHMQSPVIIEVPKAKQDSEDFFILDTHKKESDVIDLDDVEDDENDKNG